MSFQTVTLLFEVENLDYLYELVYGFTVALQSWGKHYFLNHLNLLSPYLIRYVMFGAKSLPAITFAVNLSSGQRKENSRVQDTTEHLASSTFLLLVQNFRIVIDQTPCIIYSGSLLLGYKCAPK
ncbi:MAG: hypothetical protein EZS28_012847 [Streblomastix strix]|uniref:Uncharacterized protein n=1 Tax=Streblomastix strix TaxID=222440 RepID=A0A5J4W9M8_9EUKA|nr:MAG: hypothetical protein EZS28_012847 [Streblomastix strix]